MSQSTPSQIIEHGLNNRGTRCYLCKKGHFVVCKSKLSINNEALEKNSNTTRFTCSKKMTCSVILGFMGRYLWGNAGGKSGGIPVSKPVVL